MCTFSLCMIVKNEEDVLARCLASVQDIVDEIVIVDTGSTDRTKEIASAFTHRIYDFTWIDDFAAARNASFERATMDYTMWLDADDVLLEDDRTKLLALKHTLDPSVDVVMMKYHTSFDEQGNPLFSYYRERLVKTSLHLKWSGAVHEAISPTGNILYAEPAVTHRKLHPSDPDRNLRIFERLLTQGQELEPRQQFYYARELYYHQRYQDAIDQFQRFLEKKDGWVENKIDACQQLAYCYYALEQPEQALISLLRSLAYDIPRAELCCQIGKHFFDRGVYSQAIYWYEQALACKRNDTSGAFVSPDCYGYIPYLQLCVCHDRLGNHSLAAQYNELAGKEKPESPLVQQNRTYFVGLTSIPLS